MNWKKSKYSNGSGGNNCVEVANNGTIFVRDTKDNGKGPVLGFTRDEWKAFIAGVKDGEFDI